MPNTFKDVLQRTLDNSRHIPAPKINPSDKADDDYQRLAKELRLAAK